MKIAIVQDGPVFNDKAATLEKTLDIIADASKNKADCIVFGESWFSGYPFWLDVCQDIANWDSDAVKSLWADTYNNGMAVGDNSFMALSSAFRQNSMYAVIGVNEVQHSGIGHSTIYNSILSFNNKGELVNHHRKLVPTFTEKMVYGHGDGAGLQAFQTEYGKIGSLICWEHWMPMARQVMHDSNEDVHIALWPYVKEMHQLACRHYAIEGRCHVVAVGQMIDMKVLPKGLTLSAPYESQNMALKGGSAIYNSKGEEVISPDYDTMGIIYKELDLATYLKERMTLSVSGHYHRPDVFDYRINRDRKSTE